MTLLERSIKMLTRHFTLILAALLMIIFLLFWFWVAHTLLSEVWACRGPAIGPKMPVWDGYLPCMNASELGDVLAGFFAPAAFLVLIIAVFLQGMELKAQRQELSDTRDVFITQNELLRAQTTAAEKSTALFEKQNEILSAQERARLQEVTKAELEEILKRLEVVIRTRLNGRIPLIDPTKEHTRGRILRPLFQTKTIDLPPETRAAIGTAITSAIVASAAFAAVKEVSVYHRYGHRDAFLAAAYLCETALAKAVAIGQAKSNLSIELRLGEFAELLRTYLANPVPQKHVGYINDDE